MKTLPKIAKIINSLHLANLLKLKSKIHQEKKESIVFNRQERTQRITLLRTLIKIHKAFNNPKNFPHILLRILSQLNHKISRVLRKLLLRSIKTEAQLLLLPLHNKSLIATKGVFSTHIHFQLKPILHIHPHIISLHQQWNN